ncbi:hypothetical protein GALMADRAFT_234806 [Galerina marginata CBS 339.88]|uniref:Thioredoxin domain-containing protein n=1 Tax=Galerina marginata (strain CBS 339.88) TaxID=685588 RepID=A0A067TRC1_GALM3|nr:hypothetical protein GALMADRAFT_234806 [Galerina marginata CBS 339.88]
MVLHVADGSIDNRTLTTVPERFIIFYSSIVDGEMWCPDCRVIDNLVKETFSAGGPEALIVYVGNRNQWKNPTNVYRQEPWKLTNVPTIVRLKDGKEDGRLGDDVQILSSLAEFVKA